jgi:hypothetical protein
MQNALYIGAGTDLIPVIIFSNIHKFIFVDSQPFSEHGTHTYISATNISKKVDKKDRFGNCFSRPNFIPTLTKVMNNNNFIKESETDEYLLYYSKETNQTIKYYYSCAFPEYISNELINDMKTCNTLIIAGHDPHKEVLKYLQTPAFIIGNCHTVYAPDSSDEQYSNSTINTLIENHINHKKTPYNYFLIKENKEFEYWISDNILPSIINNYRIILCKNLQDFEETRKKIKEPNLKIEH